MTTTNVSLGNTSGLPDSFKAAQAALDLPEVQAMLRKLSEFQLGIFMPHSHDEKTGQFQTLPGDVVQVESGLEVSFQPAKDIEAKTDRFVPVAWQWHAGAPRVASVCEMVGEEEILGDTTRFEQHKMKKGN